MPTAVQVALKKRQVKLLKAAGIRVEAVPGWENRGRPGLYSPIGLMQHHDASPISTGRKGYLAGIVNGKPGVAGPLAQWQRGRDGTAFLVAAGRANHAGEGGPWKRVPENSGNRWIEGLECANNGLDEPYEDPESLDVMIACLLAGMDADEDDLLGHKEWAPDRKIDPRMNMNAQRIDVSRYLESLKEGDMPLTEAEFERLEKMVTDVVKSVVSTEVEELLKKKRGKYDPNDPASADISIASVGAWRYAWRAMQAAGRAEIAALAPRPITLTVEEREQLANDVAAKLEITLDVSTKGDPA